MLLEHEGQVVCVEDQDPVQEFATQGADDPLADGVHPRCPRQRDDDPQSFTCEDRVEGGGEERIPIVDHES
ncbi:hypothetical protein [Nonomuraea insulae]|uniref:Uncharacterized protein n=1 Tax=Nonomuraea insulae TaxID=1616787 RepID=A0ABW1CRJ7_9ACTN